MFRFLCFAFLFFLTCISRAQDEIIITDTLEIESVISFREFCWIEPFEPQFPGGMSALSAFINENLHYPMVGCVQGTVYVKFNISEEGCIDSAYVARGISAEMDQAALNCINLMPDWIPGQYGVKNVAVWYVVPIRFKR